MQFCETSIHYPIATACICSLFTIRSNRHNHSYVARPEEVLKSSFDRSSAPVPLHHYNVIISPLSMLNHRLRNKEGIKEKESKNSTYG